MKSCQPQWIEMLYSGCVPKFFYVDCLLISSQGSRVSLGGLQERPFEAVSTDQVSCSFSVLSLMKE